MSHLLELLGRGLDCDFGELLDRYFRSPHTQSISSLQDNCRQTPSSPQVHFQLGLAHLRSVQYVPAAEHLAVPVSNRAIIWGPASRWRQPITKLAEPTLPLSN